MFYDFECQQETGTHIVNLAIVQDFEGQEWVFRNLNDFCKFVFTKEHSGYTFIAHNSRGYDGQFILKWCVENHLKPFCIYSGTKIMSMEINEYKISFKDSLNFVLGSLSMFPKTFGLKEIKKGYFPHLFNKKVHENYKGQFPKAKWFGIDQMKPWDRKTFMKWYENQIDKTFDLQKRT